jgi:hypothetical protein
MRLDGDDHVVAGDEQGQGENPHGWGVSPG